jgi:hypothetical protein
MGAALRRTGSRRPSTAVGLGLWQLVAHAAAPAAADILSLRRPRGLGRIPAFSRGFIRGLTTTVDRGPLL